MAEGTSWTDMVLEPLKSGASAGIPIDYCTSNTLAQKY